MSLKIDGFYKYTDNKNKDRVFTGFIEKIVTVRTGAVLAYLNNGRAFPVSKYGEWKEIRVK